MTSSHIAERMPINISLNSPIIFYYCRNIFNQSAGRISPPNGMRFAADDEFDFILTNQDVIDWSLEREVTETIDETEIKFDQTGLITGRAGRYYAILSQIPASIIYVKDEDSDAVTYTQVSNTAYIWFSSDPASDLTVKFRWRGNEPDPDRTYYLTANYLRPDSYYNVPLLLTDTVSARTTLSPVTANNDIAIMTEIAFTYDGLQGVYAIQVADPDEDGTLSIVDFREAIDASETKTDITDVVILNYPNALSYALQSVTAMNDPYEKKFRLL